MIEESDSMDSLETKPCASPRRAFSENSNAEAEHNNDHKVKALAMNETGSWELPGDVEGRPNPHSWPGPYVRKRKAEAEPESYRYKRTSGGGKCIVPPPIDLLAGCTQEVEGHDKMEDDDDDEYGNFLYQPHIAADSVTHIGFYSGLETDPKEESSWEEAWEVAEEEQKEPMTESSPFLRCRRLTNQ